MTIEPNELTTIARYIPILIDIYPIPINQTNLAKKAEVTPAAVSQIRDVLQKICDLKSMAYERKLLLKFEDNVWTRLLIYNLVNENLENFISYLTSNYFTEGMDESIIFDYFSSKLRKTFSDVFDDTDVNFAISLIKDKVVYNYGKGKEDVSINIGEQSLDLQASTTSNIPSNIVYIVSSLIDSDYSFIEQEQIGQFTILRNKILEYLMRNSEKMYSFIQKAELWLDITEDESSQIKETFELLSKRVMTKIMFLMMCHVIGMTQIPEDMVFDP